MSIFSHMVVGTLEVFMDDFSIAGDSFDECLIILLGLSKYWCNTPIILTQIKSENPRKKVKIYRKVILWTTSTIRKSNHRP